MKRVLSTLLMFALFFTICGTTLQAQSKITYGAKGGLSIANLYGDDVSGTDSKIGFTGGGFLGIQASDQIIIQLELLYAMKGTKVDEIGLELKVKLNYIETPILIKWMFPTEGNVKPSLFIGGAPAFLVSAKAEADIGGVAVEADIKDFTKRFDFGVVFGGGLDFAAGSGTFVIDVRYTLGLTSVDDTGFDKDVKNKAFSASIGYAIGVGQ